MIENNIPIHVGIIMDGNGRWAKKRGLSRSLGHRAGSKTLKKICIHAHERNIKYLSVFAFSTENFKRAQEEVDYLMNLFIEMFEKEFTFLREYHVRVVFSGKREGLREDVLKSMDSLVEQTKDETEMVLNICLNYGGQEEITQMARRIAEDIQSNKLKLEDIKQEIVEDYMYQKLPPIDFLIRTSGEYRISNFMLWQAAYAEFYFTKTLFPDFKEKQFDKALLEFQNRNRRFGGNSK